MYTSVLVFVLFLFSKQNLVPLIIIRMGQLIYQIQALSFVI